MSSEKKVSVIIPTYNRGAKVARCIESVINQDYCNLEIVIVNDASSDNTDEVIKNLKNSNKGIVYVKKDINEGPACTRNLGIKKSTGYYIAFLDDDDEWLDKNKISKQVKIFEENKKNLGIVCSGVNLVDKNGSVFKKCIKKPENIKKKILKGNGFIYCPTVMTRRDVIEMIGGFDENLSRGEDSEFYRECIVKHGLEVIIMPEITANIHEYGKRITPLNSIYALKCNVKANLYLIKKYFLYYILDPALLIVRIKKIFRSIIGIIKIKIV